MPVKSFNPKELRALGDEVEELLSKSTVREGGDIQLEKIPNLVESDLTKEQLKNMKDDFILINKLIFVDKLNVADINLDTINSEYAKRSIEQLKAEKYNVGPKLLQLRSNMESILIEKEDMSRGDSKELITEMLSDELVKIKTELRDTEKKQKEGGKWVRLSSQ